MSYSAISILSILSTISVLTLAPVHAVCPDYYVGVGTSQLCGINTSCGGAFGAIYTNNCDILATSIDTGVCGENWPEAQYGIACSNGVPTEVYTSGGNFGNCYAVNEDCSKTIGISSEYNFVDYCCAPLW